MEGIITAFGTALATVSTNALSLLASIVPIALGIAGTVYICRKAMGWFRCMAK